MSDRDHIWELQEKGICNIHLKYTKGLTAKSGLQKRQFNKKDIFLTHSTTSKKHFVLVCSPDYLPLDIDFKALDDQEKGILTEYLDAHPLFSKTRCHATKSGGRHYLFKYPKKKVTNKQHAIKLFSFECFPGRTSGFVDVPWNFAFNDHTNAMYQVLNPAEPLEITETQFKKLGLVEMQYFPIDPAAVTEVSEGDRHSTVLRLATALYSRGASPVKIQSFFQKVAPQFLGTDFNVESEVTKVIDWCQANMENKAGDVPLFDITQAGLADRIEHYFGKGDIIYNATSKTWHLFDKWYWRDNQFAPLQKISELVRQTLREEFSVRAFLAMEKADGDKAREKACSDTWKKFSAHFRECQGRDFISAALEFLRDREGFAATEDIAEKGMPIFNQEHGKINFKNTSFDFETFEAVPFDWEDFSTVFCPIDYDDEADCPQFRAFLARILDNNGELIEWMQCFLGSCLIGGENSDKILPVFWGTGDNGKSTLIEIMHGILGDYATAVDPEVLAYTKNRDKFGLSALPNKRLVTAQESEANARLDVSRVKALTGNDTQECQRKFQKSFNFKPSFKIILSTNNKPNIIDHGIAIWNRVKLVPFTAVIPKNEQIKEFSKKLIVEEGEGIVQWLIAGARKWIDAGRHLPTCKAIDIASTEYREREDVVLQWKNERCIELDDYKNGDSLTTLLKDFSDKFFRMRRLDFKENLKRLEFDPQTDSSEVIRYKLKLRTESGFSKVSDVETEQNSEDEGPF